MTLYQLTFTVNFIALFMALWLGLYLVSRNPLAPVAWLTALTLWSVGGLFINVLLALAPPPVVPEGLWWHSLLFPFWAENTFNQDASAWLQGWSLGPSVVFWHHATMLMRPGKMNAWRWSRVIAGYVLGIAGVILQYDAKIFKAVTGGDPLYINGLGAGPYYYVFAAVILVLTGLSAYNMFRSARVASTNIARWQLETLATASLVTVLIVPVSYVSTGLNLLQIPMVVMSALVAVYVVMIGYGVVRYSAIVEGRTITRDMLYDFFLTTVISVSYLIIGRILVAAYGAPRVVTIIIPVFAIFTHSFLNIGHRLMDRLFYQKETRRLRANLQQLSRLAGERETLKETLDLPLGALCNSVKATYGLILALDGEQARLLSDFKWRDDPILIPARTFFADDMAHLNAGQFPAPLQDAGLLVPLYAESKQVGALVLGQPANGIRYAQEDMDRLMYPADRIAEVLFLHSQNVERLDKVERIVEAPPAQATAKNSLPVEEVDYALRNIFDFAYLADSPLKEMDMVRRQAGERKTHVERGKAIQTIVLEALEKMRPSSEVPPEPLLREWYPYVILHNAYVEGIQNRDIMKKLYISEGTFNRTRRTAITSLARILAEMDRA
ncbi:MAG TPA: hypothetical protein VFR47_32640 [Anaerolineales bacterium]|nr:hypothetical protein [Anaerolineales bacterium]